jgi:hypothetical protein
MDITTNKDKLITEVERAIVDGQEEYRKALKFYHEKLVKHAEIVGKAIEDNSEVLPITPYKPRFLIDTLKNNLEALRAHTETTITLTNNEYQNIKSGIRDMHEQFISNVSSNTLVGY